MMLFVKANGYENMWHIFVYITYTSRMAAGLLLAQLNDVIAPNVGYSYSRVLNKHDGIYTTLVLFV